MNLVLKLGNLDGGLGQHFETSDKSLLGLADINSLLLQNNSVHGKQLKERGGGHVVTSRELFLEFDGFNFDGLMDALEHFNTGVQVLTKVNIGAGNLTATDTEQGLLGPLREPIDSCASDKGGETTDTGSENLTEGRHSDNHMNVTLNSAQVLLEHVHLGDGDLLLHAELLTDLKDGVHVFKLVEIWHVTTVKDVVDILKLLLLDDLSINKQEGGGLVIATSLHEGFLHIFTPVGHIVAFDDLDLEEFVVGAEGGKSGQRLTT